MFRRQKSEPPAAADPDRRAIYEQLAQRPETVCPFLGLAGDRVGYLDGPSEDHRCYAYEEVSPITGEQQRKVCLERGYANCPRYLRGVLVIPTEELAALRNRVAPAAIPPPPPAPAPVAAAAGGRRPRRPLVIGLLLVVLGGAGAWVVLSGGGAPVASASPSPSASPPVTSTSPSVVATPTGSDSPTPTPRPPVITSDGFQLFGSASNTGESAIIITRSELNKVGAAWTEQRVSIATGFTFSFTFGFTQFVASGADGIAVVIQNEAADALGTVGGGMGYDGISRSLAIELDSFRDLERGDLDGNHVAVHSRGLEPNSADETAALVPAVDPGINLSDGRFHAVVIDYRPGTMTIQLDGRVVLTVDVTLSELLDLTDGQAWVGITGATGFDAQQQSVFALRLVDHLTP